MNRRNIWIVVVIATVGVALVVAMSTNSRDTGSPSSAGETHEVTISGAPLPALDATGDDRAAGMSIPTVHGAGFGGEQVQIVDDGRAKVLLFAAHWCPHCRNEIPLLAESLRAEPLPAGVELITVSTGVNASAPNYPPSAWFAAEEWSGPVLADDAQSSTAAAFGLPGYPYFVFVDAHNRVVARASGEMTVDEFRVRAAALTH